MYWFVEMLRVNALSSDATSHSKAESSIPSFTACKSRSRSVQRATGVAKLTSNAGGTRVLLTEEVASREMYNCRYAAQALIVVQSIVVSCIVFSGYSKGGIASIP